MNVGVWLVPVVLAAVVLILFVSAWLEGVVAPMRDGFNCATSQLSDPPNEGLAHHLVDLPIDVDPPHPAEAPNGLPLPGLVPGSHFDHR